MFIMCQAHRFVVNTQHVVKIEERKDVRSGITSIIAVPIYEDAVMLGVYDSECDADAALHRLFDAMESGWNTFTMPEDSEIVLSADTLRNGKGG